MIFPNSKKYFILFHILNTKNRNWSIDLEQSHTEVLVNFFFSSDILKGWNFKMESCVGALPEARFPELCQGPEPHSACILYVCGGHR